VSNLAKRFITGFFGVSIIVGATLWGAESFSLLFLFIALASLIEFYNLAERAGISPQKFLGLCTAVWIFFAVSIFSNYLYRMSLGFQVIFVPLMFCIFIAELYRKKEKPFNNIAWTMLGLIYIPLSLALFTWVPIYADGYHPQIALGFFIILWSGDTGAYFVGTKLGRHRLFERHSPKKTWEGSAGGALVSLLAAYIVSVFYTDLSIIHWFAIAAIIIVVSTFGDLVESMFKRSIEIKDSGEVLPGHGGFLDRFDGVFISAPFVFVYLKLFA
jgi:phosphatidate cytidylyltransferase